MAIARRELLGLGAAVALSATLAGCSSGKDDDGRGAPASRARVPSGPPALPPPPGTLYYGASLPYHRSLPAWEDELGATVSVNRSYFGPERDQPAKLVACCHEDLAAARLPHVSIKPMGTWGDVAAGGYDEWLASMLHPLGVAGAPVILTISHEPENDAGAPGMQPSDFVAMQERAIRLAAELAPRLVIAPILQHWTFEPLRDDIDPSVWMVPSASVFGIDVYNPWSPTNGKRWRSLGSKLDEVVSWARERPIVIGEYGCRADPRDPRRAAEWLRDAAEHARSHDVVSMSYFNSDVNTTEGTWELSGRMEAEFADLLASDWVARPT
jgi:hypothetical protein